MMEPAVSVHRRTSDGEECDECIPFCMFCIGYILVFAILLLCYVVLVGEILGFKDPMLQVISAAVSELKVVNGTDLSATWNMTILITNRSHKLTMKFDASEAFVYCGPKDYYDSTFTISSPHERDGPGKLGLAEKWLSPINIDKDNQTQITFELGAVGISVRDNFAQEIADAKSLGRPVKFGLKLFVRYTFNTGVLFAGAYNGGYYYCDPLEFLFSPNTSDTGFLIETSRLCTM